MAARKTSKKVTKKKPSSKPKTAASKSSSPKSARKPVQGNRNPLYVLIIMGLATAIILMVNRYGIKRGAPVVSPERDVSSHKETEREENFDRKAREESRERNAAAEKSRDRDKSVTTEKIGVPVKPEPEQAKTQAVRPAERDVRIYLVKINDESEKMYLASVSRKVAGDSVLEKTMKELVKGPTTAEKNRGMLTAIPPSLKVNSVRIRNNIAEIDFNGAIEQGAGGSVLINRIDQIVYTATQFPNVQSVVITINGKPRQTLGADGLSIEGPLHRRR